jgi:choice-of-anchor A domain-containing protein
MKKLLSIMLAATFLASVAGIQANAYTGHVDEGGTPQFNGATSENVFGDLINWDGIVFGNTSNIIDCEGTLAVYGNFTSNRGFSVNNGAYGANPASTEDVAFLVNDYVNIPGYGNVCGQTVVGATDGNTYRLTNLTPSGTTNGTYTVADATQYFKDAKNTASAAKSTIAALPANGVCEAANGTYTFVGNADADTLVYNVNDSNFDAYLFDFTIADGQTIVVNLTSPDKLTFKNGAFRINGSMEPDVLRSYARNIVINVTRSAEIEMTSCELYGTLLAPDTALTGSNASVCGTSVLNSLNGLNGFELHVAGNNSYIPKITVPEVTPEATEEPTSDTDPDESTSPDGKIRIDVPRKMAVVFEDGTVYYGGEMRDFVYGKEYTFRMCTVNWENGIYDGNENGISGTVVYRMKVVHRNEFKELAAAAKENPDRYIVKGIDIIDTEEKMIIIDGDATDTHLETDVNSFFVAYRFHFNGNDYNKKTGIDKVVNDPIESLSVNLPAGSTITCNAYINGEKVNTADVFITTNSGEGIYESEYLTSVNDYTWE